MCVRVASRARRRVVQACLPLVALVASLCIAAGASAPPAAAAGSAGVLWGVFPGPAGTEYLYDLQSKVGRAFAAQRIYTGMDVTLPTRPDVTAWNGGRLPYHGVTTTLPESGGRKACISWASIAAGSYDAWFAQQAESLKAWGHPYVLALHHEPTVNKVNEPACGSATDYVAMWRHVVGIFQQAGATNVTFAWTMTASSFNRRVAAAFDPGSAYYGLVGVDGYSRSYKPRSPSQIFQAAETYALAQGKQLIVGEIGVQDRRAYPGYKPAWISAAGQLFSSWGNVYAILWTQMPGYYVDATAADLRAFRNAGLNPAFAGQTTG
jgi:hypothetical protein